MSKDKKVRPAMAVYVGGYLFLSISLFTLNLDPFFNS